MDRNLCLMKCGLIVNVNYCTQVNSLAVVASATAKRGNAIINYKLSFTVY